MRLYASCGERKPADERAESVRQLKAQGYPALKIRFHAPNPKDDLDVIQAVREAVGNDMHILVDANQGWQMPWDASAPWDFKTALWMADALHELGVYWLEEPLHRHDYRGLAELRKRAKLRIAGGEGNRDFSEQREYLKHGSFDVYQADVVWATGILRAQQLAREVQVAGCIYSPHTWAMGWSCWPICKSAPRSAPPRLSSSPTIRPAGRSSGAITSCPHPSCLARQPP